MKGLDFDHPFFDPLWIRVSVVTACLGWAAFEFWNGTPIWGAVFGGLGLWAGYHFFIINFHRDKDE